MFQLTRTVRFCLNDPPGGAGRLSSGSGGGLAPNHNNFSGWPAMRGLGRYYELEVCCQAPVEPVTGYMLNIKDIDRAVHGGVLPFLMGVLRDSQTSNDPGAVPVGAVMRRMVKILDEGLGGKVCRVRWVLSRYYSLAMHRDAPDDLIMTQRYEFSAAHRLHVPGLSDEENRRIFGKCNHPSGHGHNYQVEVSARVPIDEEGRTIFVEQLDAVVDRAVIQKLDHKHLNVDVPEFATLNPSVENITKVIYRLLEPQVKQLGAAVDTVRVWETEKTVCSYSPPRKFPTKIVVDEFQ